MSKKKIILIAVGIVATIIIVSCVGAFAGWKWMEWTAPVKGGAEAEREIQSADFRIYSYNHFYELCATIQKAETEYDVQYDLLPSLEPGTERYDRQQRVVAVQLARIEQLKHQYNVDARKEGTMGQFRAHDLPSYIDPSTHEYGDRTNCICLD